MLLQTREEKLQLYKKMVKKHLVKLAEARKRVNKHGPFQPGSLTDGESLEKKIMETDEMQSLARTLEITQEEKDRIWQEQARTMQAAE